MRHYRNLLGMVLAVSLCLPMSAFALKAHRGVCIDCHKIGYSPRGMSNVCITCHSDNVRGAFTTQKASNALGNHPTPPLLPPPPPALPPVTGTQTSHFWGGTQTTLAPAGSTNPPSTFYSSRYSISQNRTTCSICHDPHGQLGTQLLRKPAVGDEICRQCHTGLYKDNVNAVVTHPVGVTADYAAAVAADVLDAGPDKYKATPVNTANGGVSLVTGMVSCTSCHAVHFADSDSTTVDGLAAVANLVAGDGHLLKANGPATANNSLLCQACHTYLPHGKMADGGESVGCLSCHSGHINVGNSNVYVLKNSVTTTTYGAKAITYTTTSTSWNDNTAVTATGYCEVCHGSAETINMPTGKHLVGAICRNCHMHQIAGGVYSFQNDASVATCGDCHGFPPYKNTRGDRLTNIIYDGGYAYTSLTHNYSQATGFKDETTTPHNTHAAGALVQGAVTDYIFGGGTGACDPCHLDKSTAPTHSEVTAPGSYRDIAWNTLATGNGVLAPNYNVTTWVCTNVYCHSNGGKRRDTGKVIGDYTLATTPAWALGDATIVGKTTPTHQCNFCHGNTAASMVLAQKNNSTSHQKHLGTGTLLKTYSCNVCHSQTATGPTALSTTPNARLVKDGGKHVNGTAEISFNSTFSLGAANMGAATYTGGAIGTCLVYCHSNGKGVYPATAADWDTASTGACGTCHSISGAVLSAPHAKHMAIATVTCADCHGTNAAAGTHTGHVDGALTFSQTACNNCHGWETGETTPAWGQPMTDAYCLTCHAGPTPAIVSVVKTMTAPIKEHAKTRGHNRTTAYPVSGNLAGNKLCTSCHLTSITNHVNVIDGDATHLVAAATTCTITCHGPIGSAGKDGIITHVVTCTACHDPHGDTAQANIYMVRSTSGTNYNGTVVFTNRGNDVTPLTATNSFDEDDDASLVTHIENNADDLCATCHTALGGSGHNNRDNTPTNARHHQGETCMTASCHKPHTNATGAFKSGAGSNCNGCHGYPPIEGAHGDGTNKHTRVTLPDRAGEDLTDCAKCHTGAELYTYDLSLDLAAGGARANHGVGDVNQKNVLTASVGYNQTNFSCTTACHLSTLGDGAWTDVSGLNCNACHYYVVGATNSANNTAATPKDLKGSHNAHFAKTKPCTACHNVSTDTTHISIPTGTDLQKIQNRAAALQNEADVIGTLATQSDPGNETCSGAGVALGCHNTKVTPAWTITGITCTNCHAAGGASAADPTSGLHVGPITVSGKVHNNTLGTGCAHCHSSLTAQATHFNAVFEGGNTQKVQMGLLAAYTQTADNTGTCTGAGVAAGCHSDAGNWARKWTTTARNSDSTVCANCHGNYSAGWNSGVIHSQFATRGASHSNAGTLTYPCTDCHVIGASNSAYLFTLGSNDWQVVELGTTKHGDNKLQMNSNTTGFSDAGARVGCATATCHTTISDPYDFQKSVIFTTANTKLVQLAGDVPPVTCYNCHGGAIIGTNQNSYWPDKANTFEGGGNLSEDNIGRHQIHMEKLALSIYNETIAQLLTNNGNGTSDFKQKALCDYCHAGASNHGNKTNLPAQVTTMYNGWLPKTADDATWAAASNGNCTNLNCHNGKATVTTANFTWYGTGTQNCVVCHNDITLTTVGTTGASHVAHTGSAATFGKDTVCASCHGGSPSWSPYTVASATAGNKHIDGQFKVGTAANATIAFAYGGTYTSAATRTVGSCAVNLCHNNGKNTPAPLYTWQTAITGCAACHATSSALGGNSHTAHLVAGFATTFGKAANCQDCHDAVSAISMAGKTLHMDGAVNLAAGLTYTGTPSSLAVNVATTYGSCSGTCHNNSKTGTPVTAATWETTYSNCNICHGLPPSAGNEGARHVKHVNNTAKVVASCGECHLTATTTTYNSTNHLNATINTGNKITAHTNGTATCTNSCHLVNVARGDWLDTAALGCTDCHLAGTYLGSGANMPTSGLHAGTLTISTNTHDDQFKTTKAEGAPGTATCVTCHTATPSTAHINGTLTTSWNAAPPSINLATAVGFADAATPTCGPNTGLVTCHDDDGVWKRKWSITAKDAGDTRCANCHGDFAATGFTTGVVARHQTTSIDIDGQVGSSHGGADKCYTCHNYKAGSTTYYDFAFKHRDGAIQINSQASFVDNGTTVGCSGCHLANDGIADEQHAFAEASGIAPKFSRALEAGPLAGCSSCHGGDYAAATNLNYWPGAAGASSPDRAGEHNAHMIKLVAKLGYNMAALTDPQQKQMCAYCHPYTTSIGEGGHGDAAPSEVSSFDRIMDGLADAGTAGSFSGGNGVGGSCAAVDCHNSKTTPATHEWNDGATSACVMCHLDITDTTAGTTGASHAAHTASAVTFGKTINCASCHGAATSWAGNTPPATLHIDGTFNVGTGGGSSVPFTYSGTYTNATTRVVGSCAVNLCHNNGKNAPAPLYTWQTAIDGCAACHATSSALGGNSHTAHLVVGFATTFGKAANCQDCHDAVSAISMAGKTLHMDGAVNLAAGLTYTGTPSSLAVNVATTYGSCSGTCHNNSKTGTPVTAATWETTYSNCNICHGLPPSAGNEGARHVKHVNNTAKVPTSCGECHLTATTTTYNSINHLNATINTGNKITAHTNGSATCNNSCHIVDVARGDWLDTAALGCTDCHLAGTYLGSGANMPTTGLHAGNLTISANTHDDQFKTTKAEGAPGTATCVTCHTATPSTAHINGTLTTSWNAAPPSINLATAVGFADAATPTCGPNTGLVTCHDDDGVWKRKWSITAKDAGDTRCANCHGDFAATGFITGVVARHQTTTSGDADGQVGSSHDGTDKCYTCHNYKAGSTIYYDFAVKHRDGAIQINSQNSFTDNGTTVGCGACHLANDGTADEQHAFAEASGIAPKFTRALESGPSAGCNTCHGVGGAGGFWPIKATDDAGTADDMNQDGEHSVHVLEIAKKLYSTGTPDITQQNATCSYCHPGNGHGGANAVVPADVSRTDLNNNGIVTLVDGDVETTTYMKKIIGGTNDTTGFWRRTPATCSNVACHASAPFTPHWYADTTAPGNVTLTAVAGPVPRSIKLTWTAVGDDASIDGTAYKYDMRMGTTSVIATDFASLTNYVQGVPTVKRMGNAQETIIHNVNPSTTYYFSLRTYDRNVVSNPATTVYGTSNTVSYAVSATPDTTPPVMTGSPTWYGLDSAKALDDGTIKLSWTRAEDHTMPITYDIWWSTGTITYGTVSASTKDTSFRVTGLLAGQTYNFAVRTKDAAATPNRDTNTIVLQAIPLPLSTVPKTETIYYANGATAPVVMQETTVHTVNATTATLPTVFYGPTVFTNNTDIIANSFGLNVINGNGGITTLRAELGYITGVSTFNPFVTGGVLFATDQVVPKRATKLVTFKFNGGTRLITSAMTAKLGVRISVFGTNNLTSIGWGPASKGGILSFAAQPINATPNVPVVTFNAVSGANVSFYWGAVADGADGVADTVHYDVYGSANGGTDGFPYVIATGLTTNATVGAPLVWDTQAAGILASSSTVQVRVEAGDSINGKVLSHRPSVPTNLTVNNSGDNVAPGIINNFKAETRPKQGSIALSWTAPGDDGSNNGRAASYDIRWSNAVIDTEPKFTTATPLVSEPYPDFGGSGQGYEAVGLTAGAYYFAIKAIDEGAKTSPLVYTTLTTAAGQKCGICHSTPPDESVSIGNHAKHGFTMNECGNCHGTGAASFTTAHQDGEIKLGWKTATPATATPYLSGYKYQQNGLDIYLDGDGSGGFNPAGDNMDDGTCMSWSNQQVSGCHGPATSASWTAAATLVCSSCHGVASRPLDSWGHSFDDPSDDVKSAPPIDNHGYDGTGATEAERKYVGAHVPHLNASFRMSKGDSCRLCHGASRPGASTHADGIIDIQLDKAGAGATSTWTPGTAITASTCGSMSPEACHPSSATPKWDSAAIFACINCHGMITTPSHVTDPNKLINLLDNDPDSGDPMPGNCTWCHVGGHPKEKKVMAITKANPTVVTTENNHNLVNNDKVTIHTTTGMTEINNRTYLVTVLTPTTFSLQGSNSLAYTVFVSGTWIEGNGTGIILIQNDSRVGIAYQSGGIHLKANIGARGEMTSEAELCWGCHVANSISEWGADSAPTNVPTLPGNGNNYNFGTLSTQATTGNWIGATWSSAVTGNPAGFGYKTGTIRSTHSTDATGTAALKVITPAAYGYSNVADGEAVDAVGKIRCSNCHDVHNSSTSPLEADGLNPDGAPYLRGTWKSNPYKEDGAPWQGQTYLVSAAATPGFGYGAVPRANPSTSQAMGGYWIDQNSNNPTAGWSYESSAALCQLCHSKTVDTLDQVLSENLWISATNGHANSVLGGSGTGAANIFYHGSGGRPGTNGSDVDPNPGVWMGFQITYTDADDYAYGPRSSRTPKLIPYTVQAKISVLLFAWGNAVDAATVEVGYHQFSCSKCHNPHASRLPKLMITNCLDIARNTWDLNYDELTGTGSNTTINSTAIWAPFYTAASSWTTRKISHLSTAQNCHRYIDINNDNLPDEKGWNKVTPW